MREFQAFEGYFAIMDQIDSNQIEEVCSLFTFTKVQDGNETYPYDQYTMSTDEGYLHDFNDSSVGDGVDEKIKTFMFISSDPSAVD
jgi:hypothetical protein